MVVRHGNAEGIVDTIAGEPLYHFNGAELASMSIPAMITVFISLLTSAMALLGSEWEQYKVLVLTTLSLRALITKRLYTLSD